MTMMMNRQNNRQIKKKSLPSKIQYSMTTMINFKMIMLILQLHRFQISMINSKYNQMQWLKKIRKTSWRQERKALHSLAKIKQTMMHKIKIMKYYRLVKGNCLTRIRILILISRSNSKIKKMNLNSKILEKLTRVLTVLQKKHYNKMKRQSKN